VIEYNTDELFKQWLAAAQPRLPTIFRELQQQLRENSAGFGAITAPKRQLDPFPLFIGATDWQRLESGMLQRQRLLQLLLADIYGPQRYIQPDLLPAEALFRSPDYQLAASGLLTSAANWLPVLSLDLVKDDSGQWLVQADHAMLPAGLGYLVEHRLAFNRVAPWQDMQAPKAQVAGFYRALLQLLQQPTAGTAGNEAFAGLWISSVRNSHYFEQAYLANYLDIALVHGADLTFRDGALWLKTLTGLQSVAALLRYLPDAQADPLELEPGVGGCAGLLQSIRAQQLCCVNPPGSGLLDSAVLTPFLPQLCQAILGEPLLLAQPETLWLGDPASLERVSAAPAQYRLQQISNAKSYCMAQLDSTAMQRLWQQVLTDSADHIATRVVTGQPEPCWQPESGLFSAHCRLRLFSLMPDANEAEAIVLPGGFAQLSAEPPSLDADQNERSAVQLVKDVWVLAQRGCAASLLQNSSGTLALSRHSGLVTSRVADHLFWLGRYNERLNQICRALRAALALAGQHSGNLATGQADLAPLLQFCCQSHGMSAEPRDLAQVLQQLFDPQQPAGLFAILQSLLLNAQSAREYFAADTWLVLDKLQHALRQWPSQAYADISTGQYGRQLDDIILLQTALYGLNNETMSRTQALRLMDLGQHIERALQTAALLQAVFVPVQSGAKPSAALMESVLRLADTVNTYRRRYRSQLHPLAVIDLLVFDDSTPRSVGYQCLRIQRQCADLPQLLPEPGLSAEQRLALELVTLLQLTDPQSLFDAEQGATPALGLLLSQIQHRLKLLSDSITLSYFNHAPPSSAWQSF
jgi:uncharacterized circularly permuted ATP-grasp superfamily protein/uncharacterized alpha-E superfamily protein